MKLTISFEAGFLTDSMLTLIWFPVFSAPTTLVSSLNLIPCLVRIRWNCLATSASIPSNK